MLKKYLRPILSAVATGAVIAAGLLGYQWMQPTVDDGNTKVAEQVLQQWGNQSTAPVEPLPNPSFNFVAGKPFAVLQIPRIGVKFPVYEGIDSVILSKGIGHYPHTVGPGQLGNFATAGHDCCRQTGSPYRRIGELRQGDLVIVDTAKFRFTYTVTLQRQCGEDIHVSPEPASGQAGAVPYYVRPERVDVIWPTPCTDKEPPSQRLVTLTTCYPDISKVHVSGPTPYRIVIWAILTDAVNK
jgi:sortase (surface protein transpeptidase)